MSCCLVSFSTCSQVAAGPVKLISERDWGLGAVRCDVAGMPRRSTFDSTLLRMLRICTRVLSFLSGQLVEGPCLRDESVLGRLRFAIDAFDTKTGAEAAFRTLFVAF